MSRIGEELAKITEGVGGETTGTSDAALEIKRIIKAPDPDASTDGGTLENVIKIRELVEDGKGGGASSLKSISITNGFDTHISIMNYIDENGKYVYPSDGEYPQIGVEETMTVYYPEPAEGTVWTIELGSQIAMVDEVTGVQVDDSDLIIDPSADNGVSIIVGSPANAPS